MLSKTKFLNDSSFCFDSKPIFISNDRILFPITTLERYNSSIGISVLFSGVAHRDDTGLSLKSCIWEGSDWLDFSKEIPDFFLNEKKYIFEH